MAASRHSVHDLAVLDDGPDLLDELLVAERLVERHEFDTARHNEFALHANHIGVDAPLLRGELDGIGRRPLARTTYRGKPQFADSLALQVHPARADSRCGAVRQWNACPQTSPSNSVQPCTGVHIRRYVDRPIH